MKKHYKLILIFFAYFLVLVVIVNKLSTKLGLGISQNILIEDIVINPVKKSKGNLGNDVIYYILVDRFSDGNPNNNIPNYAFPYAYSFQNVYIPNSWEITLNKIPSYIPPVKAVYITGDFRNWSQDLDERYKLLRQPNGIYKKSIKSEIPVKNFKFVLQFVDGSIMWLVDPTQPKVGTPPLDNNIIVEQTSKEDVYNKMNQLLLQHTYDPSKTYMGLYWGGDIEGIIKKLDYLKDLGVTKIIISPIQDNANGILYNPKFHNYLYRTHQEKGLKNNLYTHVFSPYHGYWIKDWFEIDEHFRNPNDGIGNDRFQVLRRLLNEAGKRGIGVIMDLTLNHTSPSHFSNIPFVFNPNSPAAMFVDDGSIYREGKLVASYWNRQLGSIDPKGKKWFHPPKQIDFNRPNAKMLEQGMLEGLPDLNQDVPEVEKYLLDAVRFWLTFNNGSTQIVGFRLDSIKHVNLRFWQKLEKFILDINPSAILIGEYFSGGYRNPESISFLKKTNNITQFDFDLSNSARRFFAGDRAWDGRTYMLEETILGRKGNYYNYSFVRRIFHWLLNPAATLEISRKSLDSISDTDAKSWVTFSENHDLPRLKTRYINMSDSAYASLIKFQFVARGVPMIMYGMETGLAVPYHPKHKGLFGIGGDPFNRPMMIWSNSLGWKNSLYQTTKKMAHLRQKYPVLRYGDTRFLHPNKFHRDQDIFMLREYEKCNKNNNSICKSILYAYSTRGGEFKLKSPAPGISQYEVTETGEKKSIINGEIHIQLRAEEALVLILN